jgi:hypothetical protein
MHSHGRIYNKPDVSLNISCPILYFSCDCFQHSMCVQNDMSEAFFFGGGSSIFCLFREVMTIHVAVGCQEWYCSPVFWGFKMIVYQHWPPSEWQCRELILFIIYVVTLYWKRDMHYSPSLLGVALVSEDGLLWEPTSNDTGPYFLSSCFCPYPQTPSVSATCRHLHTLSRLETQLLTYRAVVFLFVPPGNRLNSPPHTGQCNSE